MPAMSLVLKALMAVVVALSMAWPSFAAAGGETVEPCCCEASSDCGDSQGMSTCGCPACPVPFPAQPLVAPRHAMTLPPVPVGEGTWGLLDESADERRAAPPVPPPRAGA